MFGRTFGLPVPRAVFSEDGAEAREKRAELADGDRCSTDDSEVDETADNRGCCG
jgi:hypothetical protein